jgi:transcriptional regulator with XRE-family HTH domain
MTPYLELAAVVEALPVLVRERRRCLGLSLREAARQLDVGFNTLARIERGEDYNSRVLPALLRWLGPTPEERAR